MSTLIAIQLPDGMYLKPENPYSENSSLEENEMRKDFNRDNPPYLALFPIAVGERVEESEVQLEDEYLTDSGHWLRYNRKRALLDAIPLNKTRQAFIRIPAKEEQKNSDNWKHPKEDEAMDYFTTHWKDNHNSVSYEPVVEAYCEGYDIGKRQCSELLEVLEEIARMPIYNQDFLYIKKVALQAILKAHGK